MTGPAPGEWLWTTREGSEADLVEELDLAGTRARVVAPALVVSPARPLLRGRPMEPVFARQGFPVAARVQVEPEAVAQAVLEAVKAAVAGAGTTWLLQVWVADAPASNRLAATAAKLEAAVLERLEQSSPNFRMRHVGSPDQVAATSGALAQVCLLSRDQAVVGATFAMDAPSRAPGGRARQRDAHDAPSRAAMKLEEAFSWLGRGPEAGEVCVDLGAAPGGWSHVLLERRCLVVAVNPAKLAPEILRQRQLRHVQASAFDYAPDQPVDWLLCDMAWRPLEVAMLLAKWGRHRWSKWLIANIKLPMKQKNAMIERVLGTLRDDGRWRNLRARQLYHDRDEITLAAWTQGS